MNAITMKNVAKRYGDFLLDIDSLEIPVGYITGFVGRNGSGKTTTIKLIMDMIDPDSGSVEVLGKSMAADGAALKQQIGLVGDLSGYVELCKARQIRDMIAPFYTNWDDALYRQLMERFRLDENQKLSNFSKGQNKLFSLIMALSHHPKLLILDEPTANLDPVARVELLEMFQELMVDEEMTILYSTHITSDLEHAGDYLIFIDEGKILLWGEKDALQNRFCIVRGDNALITPETASVFAGLHQTPTGFRGLCEDRTLAEEVFGREAIFEKPTIEDMLVFLSRRDIHA